MPIMPKDQQPLSGKALELAIDKLFDENPYDEDIDRLMAELAKEHPLTCSSDTSNYLSSDKSALIKQLKEIGYKKP